MLLSLASLSPFLLFLVSEASCATHSRDAPSMGSTVGGDVFEGGNESLQAAALCETLLAHTSAGVLGEYGPFLPCPLPAVAFARSTRVCSIYTTTAVAPPACVFVADGVALFWLLFSARGLAQGNPLFYAYTKKDTRNSDMVVHTANRQAR